MKSKLLLLLFFILAAVSCEHKELGEDNCGGDKAIKVVIHWDDPDTQACSMRINLFSQTSGVTDYGRDNVPSEGVKYIYLNEGTCHRPFCYDYNASDIYFRNELEMEAFEAYFSGASRATYDTYATPVAEETTVSAPSGTAFYAHAWENTFDVIFANGEDEITLDFYPQNILRQFTYRINNVKGVDNIRDSRGAISGMAAAFNFSTNSSTDVRSTLLFGNVRTGHDIEKGYGFIEGEFYTFAPLAPYQNRFTMELYSTASKYYNSYWNVSDQVEESMTDRPAKLARDGYDILIDNNPDGNGNDGDNGGGLPEVDPTDPNNPGSGSGNGFEIGVGDWGDEVIVELK
ncbi:hypothetical protein M2459_001686 [Parabacteroides sp. PF5-5]|uniref:DUF5119 domain-containing protein n=1 Tax=unclassified Parabacteroides TaxID=2649774 RepID=UPI002473D557|nr:MULTISPECIES: DUF5119 domain-containing protein [unclassified Parabacteroides]MDH6304949.1 hypothetical protein [Parabacteroides sp. PH5-39]MDH6315965.1 hypothetical protein [Parabacteroides sp. PF5-13]MDH6319622.1 hypothetical protein [Parabacteroides sp. PH5-13]MDH6323353.1 hypothetical protein [Parabacteroides sp. PH5-8]MDH6327138.1 hypothetical protein [Parabacteroides sp. PH5-41]